MLKRLYNRTQLSESIVGNRKTKLMKLKFKREKIAVGQIPHPIIIQKQYKVQDILVVSMECTKCILKPKNDW